MLTNLSGTESIKEIKEKVMFLEKRLYQIIAGELSTKKVVKKDKKNSGQIMLFGEELLSVNDFEQTKENYDFEELQKEKEETQVEVKEEIVKEEEKPLTVEVTEVIEEKESKVENEEIVEEETKEDIVDVSTSVEETINENKGLFESDYFVHQQKPEQEVIPQTNYFDFNNSQEIINKEKSILVVSEKKTKEETSIAKDIIALESEPEVKIAVSEVKEEAKVENKDKFASYNIKDIEQILHDSRAIESKNDKVRIEQVWRNMTRGARPEHLSVIETLQEGKVAVVGSKEFIIVFPNVSLCNIVMRRKFKDVAIRILYNLLGDTYDYAALPIDVWTSKSREYKEQYQIGIKYPTLRPLNVPGLEIASEKIEFISKNDKTINKTLELFGKDNVEIE